MAFSFLQRGNLTESARQLSLSSYVPSIVLENLVAGIDNIRHDVFISPKFTEVARSQIFKLLVKHGNVEDLTVEDPGPVRPIFRQNTPPGGAAAQKTADPGEFKRLVSELHIAALNRAKLEENPSLDLLFRLAILKFLRSELMTQYNHAAERCRAKIKQYETPRQMTPSRAMQARERFSSFQINKKAVLRRVGQDLFLTIRD